MNFILKGGIIKYHQTKEISLLEIAFDSLQKNEKYNQNALVGANFYMTISLLMNLKKYDELENMLKNSNHIDAYYRSNTLNVVRYLNLRRSDKKKADTYIKENIKRIRDSLFHSQKDSLMYADYYSMKMYLNGKKKTLEEIDSIQKIDNKFSEGLYELLKETIRKYPDEHL